MSFIEESLSRAKRLNLPDEVLAAINKKQVIWQEEDGHLVNLAETTDIKYDIVKQDVETLQGKGMQVFYAFADTRVIGILTYNYVYVSAYKEDWKYELVDQSFDSADDVKTIALAVKSDYTHGIFDFGSCYVACVNNRLQRVSMEDILQADATNCS